MWICRLAYRTMPCYAGYILAALDMKVNKKFLPALAQILRIYRWPVEGGRPKLDYLSSLYPPRGS